MATLLDQTTPVVGPPASVKPSESTPSALAETAMPIFELAKQLGGDLWSRVVLPSFSVDGKATQVVAYDGPGWKLAGLMAGNHLDEHSLITKSKLLQLADAVGNITMGVHTNTPHPKGT